jgi:hypothetical protein
MPNTVTESIFNGGSVVVPMADVQHIERHDKRSVPGVVVITKHTRWDAEAGTWANSIWISQPEAAQFTSAWCRYRGELEADTLADLSPQDH